MPWLSGRAAGVVLREPDRHAFSTGPTIEAAGEAAGLNVFRDQAQGQVPGYGAHSAPAYFLHGNVCTLLGGSTCAR
jgi:hypothetical protein